MVRAFRCIRSRTERVFGVRPRGAGGTGWECFTFSVALDRSVCGATSVPARSLKYPASAERRVGGLPVFSAIAAPMGSRWGIGGLRRHGRRDKDVMRGIDGGLGALGVHKRLLGVLHDVRVGIRQVVLDAVGRSVAPRRRGSPPPRHGVGMAAGNGGGTYQSARVSRARATT